MVLKSSTCPWMRLAEIGGWYSEAVLVFEVSACGAPQKQYLSLTWAGGIWAPEVVLEVSTRSASGKQYLGGRKAGFCRVPGRFRNSWRDFGGIMSGFDFRLRKSRRNPAVIPFSECRVPGGFSNTI